VNTNVPNERLQQRQVAILCAIFFVSGFCGLIYESIWSHYLKLLLGHAAYAQAVVLVVFVGGLALGAWITGLAAHRIRRPIVWYAAVEAAVAMLAFGFQQVFEQASSWASASFLPAMCGDTGACGAAWALAAALILPASILLGATFPLMTTGVMRLGARPGRGLSLLYFLNSAGAALGVLISGFVLIPRLGLPGTIMLAGACNTAVALAAYLTACAGRSPAHAQTAADATTPPRAPRQELRLLLAVAALTGLSSFLYEVAWIRMLTLVLGAATHAFELMLAPFILGLALGAWWIRDRIDDHPRPLLLLARIQVAMGLLAVATLPLYASLFDAMAWVLQALARNEAGYALFNLTSLAMAAAVMLPATVCAGMTLPVITATLLRRGFGERQVGQVYGVNTFGAIAGVLLAVHLLMPVLGLKWTLATGAAIDVALGVVLWWSGRTRADTRQPRWLAPAGVAAGGVAALAILAAITAVSPLDAGRLASGVYRYGVARADQEGIRILFHRDGKTATVTVRESADGVRILSTNGKPDGSTHPQARVLTPDDSTMVLLGALGPLHHPAARKAAVIGMGTGSTTAVLLDAPGIRQVDTIEIEPMMVEAARLFRPRVDKVFTDPRSRIVIDDARAHFSRSGSRYDLIVSEPSNPWVSGVSALFSEEFYQHVSSHLAPDGHFVQWLHLYEASPEMVASIVRAFALVFPEFRAYATNSLDVVLVARNDGRTPRLQAGALAAMPLLRRQLAGLGIDNMAMLAAHETARPNTIKLLANAYGVPPNRDFFPYVDSRAAEDRFQQRVASGLFALQQAPVPLLEFVAGAPAHAGRITHAGPHMPFPLQRYAAAAQGLRFLQGRDQGAAEVQALGTYASDYALVRSWFADCHLPAGTGELWTAMVNVASTLNPGQSAEGAGGYWRSLAQGRCRQALSPVQRAWVQLFAATGARDARAAGVHAREVLASDRDLTTEARSYATLAAVSADITLGRREEAASLLREQGRELPASELDTPWFRYLALSLAARSMPAAP